MPAHCEQTFSGTVKVGALCTGLNSLTNCGQEQEGFPIKDYWIHPDYNDSTLNNDYALVKLDGTSSITPVLIDDGNYSPNYTSGKINFFLLRR